MSKFSLLIAVGLAAIWLSQPVHAESPLANPMGNAYTTPPPAGNSAGPVKSPAKTKQGVVDDSVMRRAKKKPNR